MAATGLLFISLLLGAGVFQNCARTNYLEDSHATATALGGSRKLSIDPSFNQQKANLKVLFVVDDSYTMSQSQTYLANALDSLLNPLKGHNVDFKIVSTSGIPSNEVDYNISNRFMTEQNLTIPQSQTAGLSSYLVEKTISNKQDVRHGLLKLFRDATASQFNDLKTQVRTAILNVGVNGSEIEEGLCASVRQLYDTSANSFFKAGDKAAIVILSDENDTSEFAKCVNRYVQRVSAQPVVYYSYGQQRAKLTLEYQMLRDGVASWVPVVWGISLTGARSITLGANCSAADQTASINKISSQGYVIRNVTACNYESVPSTYYGVDLGDNGTIPNKDLCSSTVVYNNVSYPNLYAMVNSTGSSAQSGSCVKQVLPGNTISPYLEYDSVFKSDAIAASSSNFNLAIKNKASQLFGGTGYMVAGLVRKSGESCALSAGQSYGVSYEALATLLGPNNSVIQSLCNSDFSATLSQVSANMVTEANSSYVISLQDGEGILSVSLLRGGVSTLLSNSDYEVAGATITLTGVHLQAGDTLEVTVGKTK